MPDVAKLLAGQQKATSQARGAIEKIRDDLARLRQRRRQVERAPVPQAEAERRLEAEVARLSTAFVPDEIAASLVSARGTGRIRLGAEDVQALAVRAAADVLRNEVGAAIAASYAKREGISAADRRSELEGIDGEIFHLEVAEEQLIRASEEHGPAISRRPDAQPRIVLMFDEELSA